MDKETIIKRTVDVLNHLPERKAEEVSEFALFVFKRFEEEELLLLQKKMVSIYGSHTPLSTAVRLFLVSQSKETAE